MCELFISLILGLMVVIGVGVTLYLIASMWHERKQLKLSYKPIVKYEASTGRVRWFRHGG